MSTLESHKPVQIAWHGRAGDWAKRNQGDIVLVIGFVLVALISFGVGYLSAPAAKKMPIVIDQAQVQAADKQGTSGQGVSAGEGTASASVLQSATGSASAEKGLVVASKNSTIYHWPWCAAAKRIKPENQVWFKSEAEAQAAGYKKCADFDKSAPTGYKPQ